jgi:GntR family transcriptional regulator
VVWIRTLRLANDLPVTIYDEYAPYKLRPELLVEELDSRPIWQILESHGYVIKRAVQRIEARMADEDIAGLLNIEECVPVLFKHRIIYAEDGTPVELIRCYNRGDVYSANMILVR